MEKDVEYLEKFGYNESNLDIQTYHHEFAQLTTDIASCLHHKVISYSHAKKIIDDCWDNYCGYDIMQYLCATRLLEESSSTDILGVVREAISKSEKAVKEYKSGNIKAIGAIVGSVLKIVKADAKMVSELIKQELEKETE